jgi:hypothetical protein
MEDDPTTISLMMLQCDVILELKFRCGRYVMKTVAEIRRFVKAWTSIGDLVKMTYDIDIKLLTGLIAKEISRFLFKK